MTLCSRSFYPELGFKYERCGVKDGPTKDKNQIYAIGVALAVFSAIAFSTMGIFTKGVAADAWSVIFWRAIGAAAFAAGYGFLSGKLKKEWQALFQHAKSKGAMLWPAILVIALGISGTAAFIPAFKLSTVSNIALIYATVPLFAAFVAWALIGEKPGWPILIASLVALAGVAIMLGGSFDAGHLAGDLLGLWMTAMLAGVMVCYRIWPGLPTILPSIAASLAFILFLPLIASPMQATGIEISILIAFGLIFAFASITLAEAATRIPAAHVALLGALETPLAPIWAFLLLAEIPASATLLGGALVLVSVLWAQWWQIPQENT